MNNAEIAERFFSTSDSHLLLQDVDLPLFDLQHVLHVPDFSSESALLLRQVLQLLGLLVQEGLFLLQTQTESIHLKHDTATDTRYKSIQGANVTFDSNRENCLTRIIKHDNFENLKLLCMTEDGDFDTTVGIFRENQVGSFTI